jgi:prefoldin alpha subunit
MIMEQPDKRRELQEMLFEAESYKKQMDSVRREMEVLGSLMSELDSSIKALAALKESKAGQEILVPIGGGSFIRASLKEPGKVLVGTGANISMEKDIDSASKILAERNAEMNSALERLKENAAEINSKLAELDEGYRVLVSEMQTGSERG